MGLNHIDVRLGVQCNYGVLEPLFGTPILGVPRSGVPPDLGSGGWAPRPQILVTHSVGSQVTRSS